MARTALTQLQEQIEAIRREAFAAGYAAAMESIRDFAAKSAPARPAAAPPGELQDGAVPPRRRRQPRVGGRAPDGRRARGTRPQRGTNARLIEAVLQSNAPNALRPAEIRSAIQREHGVAIAFTSIRHALAQLETRELAEQVGDSKTWRHRAAG